MSSNVFYRNVRSRELLELFLLSAISSLLLLRLYLHAAGYPQLVHGGLHIAHMLWGGLLMVGSVTIMLTYLGKRTQRIAVIVGGVGFGVFIDELGKFVTRDNNYFFRPAVGIIYAIFAILYLLFNFLGRTRQLSSREYQLNALSQLEEAIVRNMDVTEKARVQWLIDQADPKDPLTAHLQQILDNVQAIPAPRPSRIRRVVSRLERQYQHFWQRKSSSRWVQIFFVAEVAVFTLAVSANIYSSIHGVFMMSPDYLSSETGFAFGQLASALVAVAFTTMGVVALPRSRFRAYEQFRRATLVNLFLTEFFIFARTGFEALPGFIFNLVLLGLISYAQHQERTLRTKKG